MTNEKMIQGRTHKPELRPELCGTCRICLSGCPGRVFRDLSTETDTVRGRLAKEDQKLQKQPPCQLACPIAQDIPGYLDRIAAEDSDEALAWILRDNPFPAVLGYVCHHPCEQACVSGSIQQAPAIRELKRFASMAIRPGIKVPSGTSKGKVAIVGSGPAGLASAWALSREGVQATVYESLPVPGGLPAWAIPPFRLPRKAVQEDVDYILRHGVELQLNRHLHPEEVMALRSEYDAVVLACGAATPKQTDIPGSELPGVWLGLDFLRRAAFGPAPEIISPVIVVGGGNVATDSARWALRMASPVTLVYRRDPEDMPAYPEEVETSLMEGIEFVFRSAPVAFEGDARKGVRQICLQTTRPDATGENERRSFIPVSGTKKIISAGTVILALGQEKGFDQWTKALGIRAGEPSEGGVLKDRIYAAGDMVTGPGTVVEAVAGGIHCARKILREVFA
jgi:NADPH-dependent glutamate synthase beta subunit-like oxidoreductase